MIKMLIGMVFLPLMVFAGLCLIPIGFMFNFIEDKNAVILSAWSGDDVNTED
tara:strand:- start:1714 stop:1869 length:156 start_codon:yes stop_codon:yes gene_type:complete